MIRFMVPTKLGSVPSSSSTLLSLWNTTNTMMLDEHIQSYRISFELTKSLQSDFVGTMKRIINFLCALRLDPELMERVHMNVCDIIGEQPITTEQAHERASEIQHSFVKGLEMNEELNTLPLKYLSMKDELIIYSTQGHM